MKRAVTLLTALTVVGASLVVASTGPASADATASIATSCDRPNTGITAGLFTNLNNEIPDPIHSTSTMGVVDTPDPAVQGQPVRFDLNLPFPDLAGGFTPISGITYGYIYLRSVVVTIPIPSGVNVSTVTPTQSPVRSYVTASRSGNNLVIRVQSARATGGAAENGRIRINADAVPATPQVQEANGTWVPVVMPTITITPTVTGAAGSSIVWRPPSTTIEIKYDKDFGFLIGQIHWNDLAMPCTPDNPNQAIATTTVGSPGLSVSTSADETSVVAGATVHLHATATNTGNVALTGVVITDANAPGCAGSPGTIAVGGHVTLDCTVVTSGANVPTFTNTAGADSNETAAVTSSPVSVTVTSAGPTGISGTVTETGSGAPLPDAWVALLRTNDLSIAGGAATNGAGDYSALVPAGSYYEYLIDPSGAHAGGFFGAPTAVTVPLGTMVDKDPTMTPTRGSVTGTVTEDGTATPVAGAWAIALSQATGAPEKVAVANGSGQFSMGDLKTGNHLMVYADPGGAHTSEFFTNSSDATGANPVAVTAGGSTTANDSMATQAPNPGGSTLTGTVTETGTGTPLQGIMVMAMSAANYRLARAGVTDGSGHYTLSVATGDYKLVFLDGTGRHNMEWHNDQPYFAIANATSVTAPAATDAALDVNTGAIAGTITDDPANTPVAGAWVIAIGANGIAGGAVTAPNGTYTIAGLTAGTYRAAVIDPTGAHRLEYWNNSADFAGANPISVAASATTTINAAIGNG